MSICVKKEIETRNGLFRIGAVVLNEDETWKDYSVKPICADNDFMLQFVPFYTDRKRKYGGVHVGKKHFCSLPEAEAYIYMLDITGFSLMDL